MRGPSGRNVDPAGVGSLGLGQRALAGDGEVNVLADELFVLGEEREVAGGLVEASEDLMALKLQLALEGAVRLGLDLSGDENLPAELKVDVGEDVGVGREFSGAAGVRDDVDIVGLSHLSRLCSLVEGAHQNSNRFVHLLFDFINYKVAEIIGGHYPHIYKAELAQLINKKNFNQNEDLLANLNQNWVKPHDAERLPRSLPTATHGNPRPHKGVLREMKSNNSAQARTPLCI